MIEYDEHDGSALMVTLIALAVAWIIIVGVAFLSAKWIGLF